MIKILLIEDNLMVGEMIVERLTMMGYQARHTTRGENALELALTEQPDVILMDISLPEMDGLQVTRQLKADPRTQHIPVIALTAHAMPEARERSLAAGCADFEVKPINFTRLAAKIEALTAK
jgi:CheY-like chemotaxis protein